MAYIKEFSRKYEKEDTKFTKANEPLQEFY